VPSRGSRLDVAPLVSVVVPAYNSGAFIRETIRSVLTQTLADLEMIVVDDGSTDETPSLVAQARDPRVRLIQVPHSGLPPATRNRGLREARGRFVAFLDADDLWLPGKLEAQVRYLETWSTAGCVHTAARHLVDGRVEEVPPLRGDTRVLDGSEAIPRLLTRTFIYNSSSMVRREVLDQVGWLLEEPGFLMADDLDLWLRMAEGGLGFGYVAEPLILYRVRPDSVSRDTLLDLTCTLRVLDRAKARAPRLYRRFRGPFRRRMRYVQQNLGEIRIRQGLQGGLRSVLNSLRLEPLSARAWAWLMLALLGPRPRAKLLKWHQSRRHGLAPS